MISQLKNLQAFGLFVIILAKRVVKHLRSYSLHTPAQKYHCKRYQTEKPSKKERTKWGKMVSKTTIYIHPENGCPKLSINMAAL